MLSDILIYYKLIYYFTTSSHTTLLLTHLLLYYELIRVEMTCICYVFAVLSLYARYSLTHSLTNSNSPRLPLITLPLDHSIVVGDVGLDTFEE